MFFVVIAFIVLWLILDYKKDKKIEKHLRREKEEAQSKGSKQENQTQKQ